MAVKWILKPKSTNQKDYRDLFKAENKLKAFLAKTKGRELSTRERGVLHKILETKADAAGRVFAANINTPSTDAVNKIRALGKKKRT